MRLVATVSTVAYLGLEARGVEVQCQVAAGVPGFVVVGLPDKAVAESRERVRAAISAIGLSLPPKRITVNLSRSEEHTSEHQSLMRISYAVFCLKKKKYNNS